jgi:DNA-binding MarR family transcriptional regulator
VQDVAFVEESIELLPQISRLVYSAISAHPEFGSLTIAQGKAIAFLYHEGEQTMGALAAGLGIGMPAASELVDRLEERELVRRTVDPADRRRAIVELTGEALAFARRMHDLRRRQVRAALAQLDPEEWPIFVKTLRALAVALESSASIDATPRETAAGRPA